MAHSKAESFELALADLSYVLDKNPDHVNAAFARAALYNRMGELHVSVFDSVYLPVWIYVCAWVCVYVCPMCICVCVCIYVYAFI
ncbi:hypothetical protein EON63_22985 [archaeon]|nr:MAG: hypothetical protein EON63_22985 [archaeon]